jgi:hypothetical protein
LGAIFEKSQLFSQEKPAFENLGLKSTHPKDTGEKISDFYSMYLWSYSSPNCGYLVSMEIDLNESIIWSIVCHANH